MPNVYKPNLIQIRPQHTIGGVDNAENVTWWQGSFGTLLSLTQLQNIASAFNTAYEAFWKPIGSSTNHYTGCFVTDWSSSVGQQVNNIGFVPVAGTAGAGFVPPNTAVLVSITDGVRYRGGHGRIYVPGGSNAYLIDPSHIQSSSVTTFNTNFQTFLAAMAAITSGNGGPFDLSIYHKRDDVAHAVPTFVSGFVLQPELATQRRRLRKAPHH